jgi:serine/threonine-protein kinase
VPETPREVALVLVLLNVAHMMGGVDDVSYRAERQRLVTLAEAANARTSQKRDPYMRSYPWIVGYATGCANEADAREALEALPQFLPLPPPRQRATDIELVIGQVFLRGGRVDEALPYLESAAGTCFALENVLAYVYAYRFLGMAREAKGDRAAYRTVLRYFGHARPRSDKATLVRARLAALGDPPGP